MTQNEILKGAVRADEKYKPRLIVAPEGIDGAGKTYWSLTAPGAIAVLSIDTGLEGVIEKFAKEKEIFIFDYLADWLNIDVNSEMESQEVKDICTPIWERIKEDFANSLASPLIRTVILDTATELYDVARYAMIGRLALPKEYAYKYGPVNLEYTRMIKRAYNTGKTLVLNHRMKEQYIDDKATGKMILAGCTKLPYEVQARIRLYNDEGEFSLKIIKCRHNGSLVGMELEGDSCNFTQLAMMLFPDTKEEDWQ